MSFVLILLVASIFALLVLAVSVGGAMMFVSRRDAYLAARAAPGGRRPGQRQAGASSGAAWLDLILADGDRGAHAATGHDGHSGAADGSGDCGSGSWADSGGDGGGGDGGGG